MAIDIEPPDLGRATGLGDQASQDIDERGLAGAIRSQQAENRATFDFQINALQRAHFRQLARCAIGFFQSNRFNGVFGLAHAGLLALRLTHIRRAMGFAKSFVRRAHTMTAHKAAQVALT